MFERLYRANCPLGKGLMRKAASLGLEELVFWLRGKGVTWGGAISTAFKHSHLSLGKKMILNDPVSSGRMYFLGIFMEYFDLEEMQWMVDQGVKVTGSWGKEAGRRNDREMIDYLLGQNQDFGMKNSMIVGAAKGGHFDLLISLVEEFEMSSLIEAVGVGACESKKKNVLLWCINNGVELTCNTVAAACKTGRMDLVKMTIAAGAYYNSPVVFKAAVESGCRKMMEWALEMGISRIDSFENDVGMMTAASIGDLSAMKWLYQNGSKMGQEIEIAAHRGDLEMIKWARSRGAGWGGFMKSAANGGHFQLVKWGMGRGIHVSHSVMCTLRDDAHVSVSEYKWLCDKFYS
jgi:hypothetical protein